MINKPYGYNLVAFSGKPSNSGGTRGFFWGAGEGGGGGGCGEAWGGGGVARRREGQPMQLAPLFLSLPFFLYPSLSTCYCCCTSLLSPLPLFTFPLVRAAELTGGEGGREQ